MSGEIEPIVHKMSRFAVTPTSGSAHVSTRLISGNLRRIPFLGGEPAFAHGEGMMNLVNFLPQG